MKKDNIELTFFEGDERYITSVVDENGNRPEGTKADAAIWKTVQAGKDYHADGVQIAGADYYVYYTPVYSDAGDVIGMGFAGDCQRSKEGTCAYIVTDLCGDRHSIPGCSDSPCVEDPEVTGEDNSTY